MLALLITAIVCVTAYGIAEITISHLRALEEERKLKEPIIEKRRVLERRREQLLAFINAPIRVPKLDSVSEVKSAAREVGEIDDELRKLADEA